MASKELDNLLARIHELRERQEAVDRTEAGKLIKAIMDPHSISDEAYWYDVKRRVDAFFKSDASEADKEMLGQYTESLSMTIAGIEWRKKHKK